ncbi:MAG: ribulose-phosphate 3-epimerase [Anaerolineae bacterium]
MTEARRSVILEASILSADFARLGEDAQEAEAAGVDVIQIDVMDGVFVPNITFGPGVVKALRSRVSLPLDVHLMIVEPERHLEAFAKAGADRLIVHQEACRDLHLVLTQIRQLGIEAGVTLNPGTPLVTLEEVLYMVDLIQIMTVSPGWGGQALIETQLDKIHRLREWLDQGERWVPIAVDGGVDAETAPRLVEAGATVLISGSSIYGGPRSVAENVAALRASVAEVSYRA